MASVFSRLFIKEYLQSVANVELSIVDSSVCYGIIDEKRALSY